MLQCRFCLAEFGVEDVDVDGIVECECGARFPVDEALYSPGVAAVGGVEDDDVDDDLNDDAEPELEF